MRAPPGERPALVQDRFLVHLSGGDGTGGQAAPGPAQSEGPDTEPPPRYPARQRLNARLTPPG
jgi:hypothetical protein